VKNLKKYKKAPTKSEGCVEGFLIYHVEYINKSFKPLFVAWSFASIYLVGIKIELNSNNQNRINTRFSIF